MKKKILSMALALCLAFGTVSTLPHDTFTGGMGITAAAAGETFVVGDIEYYQIDSKTAGVYRYKGAGGDVTVPKTVNGLTVTAIGEEAFYRTEHFQDIRAVTLPDTITEICEQAFFNTGLTKINLPESLTKIGEDAFKWTHIKSVTLPSKLTSIPSGAFNNCESLEAITIHSNIKTIGPYAFDSCTALKKLVLSEGLTRIMSCAFYGCKNITELTLPSTLGVIGELAFERTGIKSIKIPNNVVQIGEYAFSNCEYLSSVTLNSTLQSIGKGAFSYCSSLQSISLPNSITEIEGYTFEKCGSLKSIKLPAKLKSVGEYAFSYCEKLESISLPSTVTTLGKYAFFVCEKIKTVNIPNGVTELPDCLFNCCRSLEKLTIPSSVKKIGAEIVTTCFNLKSLTLPNSITEIPKDAFRSCSLQKIVLPSGLKTIGESAFANSSLTEIKIPSGVTTIGDSAFEYCDSLTDVTIPNTVKSIGKYAFRNTGALETVTVPDSVTSIGDKAFGFVRRYNTKTETYTEEKMTNFRLIYAASAAARNYADSNGLNYAQRLAGSNRYATAAEISKNTYDSAKTVVIASGENYADALAGVPYAKSIGAPILLTTKDKLPAETLTEIKGIGAKNAVILGGAGAVSDGVKKELEKAGLKVERVYGSTRFSTATSIAKKTNSAPTDIFFVVGSNYADALSVSSVAAIKKAPIVYLTTSGELNADTAAYLKQLKSKGCVKNAYVIGGEGAISPDMLNKASNALGVKAVRISGDNRYTTCIAINDAFSSLFVKGTACLATGANFPDALAGGVFAAKKIASLVLTSPTVSEPQYKYFEAHPAKYVFVFGGAGAVSEAAIRKSTCIKTN